MTRREAIDYNTPDRILMAAEEARDQRPEKMKDCYISESGCWDWVQIKAIGDFAAANPKRWKTIAAKLDNPDAGCRELAEMLNTGKSSISRHLKHLKII